MVNVSYVGAREQYFGALRRFEDVYSWFLGARGRAKFADPNKWRCYGMRLNRQVLRLKEACNIVRQRTNAEEVRRNQQG